MLHRVIIELSHSDLGLPMCAHPFKNVFELFHVSTSLGQLNKNEIRNSQLSNNDFCGTIKSTWPINKHFFHWNCSKGMECSVSIIEI